MPYGFCHDWRLRKLGKYKIYRKSLKCLEFIGKCSASYIKEKNLTVVLQKCKKSALKHSIQKTLLLNLVDWFTIFCPRLDQETSLTQPGPHGIYIFCIFSVYSLLKIISRVSELQQISKICIFLYSKIYALFYFFAV